MKKLFILNILILSNIATAAGKGGHGSVTDLMWPVINFTILGLFIVLKLRKPISNMFDEMYEAEKEFLSF